MDSPMDIRRRCSKTRANFVDYNDRLVRLITDQAARELLGTGVAVGLITDCPTYYRALDAANHGNLDDLTDLIRVALE